MIAPSLLHCPFCGGVNVEAGFDCGSHFMFCRECFADGPIAPSKAEAQKAWNVRKELNDAV